MSVPTTFRVWCDACDNYGDVPDYDAAVDWEEAHWERFHDHKAESEPYPFPMMFPIDPESAKIGGF